MNIDSQIPQGNPDVSDAPQFENGNAAPAVSHTNLLSIMARQNKIPAMLVHQQRLLSLPNREIQVFDGDSLLYHAFMRAFEHNIEKKTMMLQIVCTSWSNMLNQEGSSEAVNK